MPSILLENKNKFQQLDSVSTLYLVNLVHFSLTAQSHFANASSLACGATSLMLQSLKYLPLTVAKSSSRAAYKVVWAPFLGDLRKGQDNGLNIKLAKNELKKPMCRKSSVSTTPGWRALTVTPVPR